MENYVFLINVKNGISESQWFYLKNTLTNNKAWKII